MIKRWWAFVSTACAVAYYMTDALIQEFLVSLKYRCSWTSLNKWKKNE